MPPLIQRITIDLDSKSRIKVFISKFILMYYGFKNISVKKSPSKRGYHIVGWHNKGYFSKKLLCIRKLALDDKLRIYLDTFTHRQHQVLFDKKKTKTTYIKF